MKTKKIKLIRPNGRKTETVALFNWPFLPKCTTTGKNIFQIEGKHRIKNTNITANCYFNELDKVRELLQIED
jgi:hypothetical protein